MSRWFRRGIIDLHLKLADRIGIDMDDNMLVGPVDSIDGLPLMDVDEVIALEKEIEGSGTSLLALMERAGASIAELAKAIAPPGSRIVALCGSGNNGGDGWVAAGLLASDGYDASIVTSRLPEDMRSVPARDAVAKVLAEDDANGRDGSLSIVHDPSRGELEDLLSSAALVIDAILGTGFDGDSLKEPYAMWVHALYACDVPILAADVPSGVSARTGHIAEPSVSADATVTMLALKPGLISDEAASYIGDLYLARLGQ